MLSFTLVLALSFINRRIETLYDQIAPTLTAAPALSPTLEPDTGFQYFALSVFELINAERCAHGFEPLLWHDVLYEIAWEHSKDMATGDFMSHWGTDGSNARVRVSRAGIRWLRVAENIAAGQSTPEMVVAAWMSSPGHRGSILNPLFTHLGVGFYHQEGTQFRYYWTLKFIMIR